MSEVIRRGIEIFTKNEDGTWTRTVDEAGKQAIIDKLQKLKEE